METKLWKSKKKLLPPVNTTGANRFAAAPATAACPTKYFKTFCVSKTVNPRLPRASSYLINQF